MKIQLIAIFFIPILLSYPAHANAQEIQDGYYYLDADENPVKEEKAAVILHVSSIGDSCKQFNYQSPIPVTFWKNLAFLEIFHAD